MSTLSRAHNKGSLAPQLNGIGSDRQDRRVTKRGMNALFANRTERESGQTTMHSKRNYPTEYVIGHERKYLITLSRREGERARTPTPSQCRPARARTYHKNQNFSKNPSRRDDMTTIQARCPFCNNYQLGERGDKADHFKSREAARVIDFFCVPPLVSAPKYENKSHSPQRVTAVRHTRSIFGKRRALLLAIENIYTLR